MEFKDLTGMVFTKIDVSKEQDEMIFHTTNERKFLLYHCQD